MPSQREIIPTTDEHGFARKHGEYLTTKTPKPMKQLTDIQKERLRKAIKYLVVSIATAIAMALGLTSCNVTRTITTESRSVTKGDTAIIIQTKTIESYNAKKN